MNAPCLCINNWPKDGSLEPKHVANYVLMTIYIYIYISMNAPCVCIKNWPEDGSLEPKHVANYVLMTIYMLCIE